MRLLIAHSFFPEPDTNAGSLRLWEIIRLLLEQGHRVTFLAAGANDPKYRAALERLGAACALDERWSLSSDDRRFREFLEAGGFDAAILVQYGIFGDYAPRLRALLPRCRLILDTVDLHFLRTGREAALRADHASRRHAEEVAQKELAAIRSADAVWVISEAERRLLGNRLPDAPPIRVVPLIHRACAGVAKREGRAGIAFLGGYRHAPNVDAVHYFFSEIFPALERALPRPRVIIAGSHLPAELGRHLRDGVVLAGFVEDHRALLGSCLVGMAPLRYGAGMKGKIGEYLACGLPCVTTSIGAEGMGLIAGKEALIEDDPAGFARAIARLHEDAALWERLHGAGIAYIRERLSPQAAAPAIQDALRGAARTSSYKAAVSEAISRMVRG